MSGPQRATDTTVVLSIGSNVEPREEHILSGIRRLMRIPGLRLISISSLYETEPVDICAKTNFVNAACVAVCNRRPRALLEETRAIEHEAGRDAAEASRDRTLDIDIILYGDEIIQEKDLVVPHPRFSGRRFVLVPLMEIGAGIGVPPSGRTIESVFRECGDHAWVRRISGRMDPLNFLKTK